MRKIRQTKTDKNYDFEQGLVIGKFEEPKGESLDWLSFAYQKCASLIILIQAPSLAAFKQAKAQLKKLLHWNQKGRTVFFNIGTHPSEAKVKAFLIKHDLNPDFYICSVKHNPNTWFSSSDKIRVFLFGEGGNN